MSLAIVYSRARCGMEAPLVMVEVHLSNGLPSLSIVGLPETAVKESKDRVRGALLNSRFEFPARRITINLAPADLPKEGGRFDLPIAIGILAASGQVPTDELQHYEFAAELALSGELRGVHGVLPMTLKTTAAGRSVVVSGENAAEATLVIALLNILTDPGSIQQIENYNINDPITRGDSFMSVPVKISLSLREGFAATAPQ